MWASWCSWPGGPDPRALRRPRRAAAADFFYAPPPPTSGHRRAAAAAADFLSARRRFWFRLKYFNVKYLVTLHTNSSVF